MSKFGFGGGDAHAQWLAGVVEPIIDAERRIIDAHHHLWLRAGAPYLFPELVEDLNSGHRIVATVFAECHSMYRAHGPEQLRCVGETEFVAGVAAMSDSGMFGNTRACRGIFGAVDLALGSAVVPVLEAHIAAGGGRFRGIRASTCWHADTRLHRACEHEGTLLRPSSLAAFDALQQLQLTLDVWLFHTQLQELITLADRLPDLTIILDHFGTPILGGPYRGRRDEVFADWRQNIVELARRPNVSIKLGALPIRFGGSEVDRSLPPGSVEIERAWRPWFEIAVDAFGAERAMFESNFPVHKNWCSYAVHWNACKRLAASASASEKQALFASTAARVYRIDDIES